MNVRCRLFGHDWEIIPLDEVSDSDPVYIYDLGKYPLHRCSRCGALDKPLFEQMEPGSPYF